MEGEILTMRLWPDRIEAEIQRAEGRNTEGRNTEGRNTEGRNIEDRNIEDRGQRTEIQRAEIQRTEVSFETGEGRANALRTAIYGNPQLVGDFDQVHVTVDTPCFMVVPSAITDPALQQQMMQVLWPGDDYEVMADSLTEAETLLWGIDREMLSFIRRMYLGAAVTHRLTPMVSYYYEQNRQDNLSRMYVNLRGQDMDIAYIRDGRLAIVNTYHTPTVPDMMYYIMAAAQAAAFSEEYDELVLIGDSSSAQGLQAELRSYVRNVKLNKK